MKARAVRLGLRTLDAVEVLDGLAPCDVVLLAGQANEPGQRVRLNMQAWQPSASAGPGSLTETSAPVAATQVSRR